MSRVRRNLVFLLVSQIATWSITTIVLLVAPDRLGVVAWGQFGFATAFIQYFTLAASLGTGTLLVKTVARDPSVLPVYVYNALILKVVVVAGLSVLALLVAGLIGTTGDSLLLVAIGCLGMLFIVLNEVFVGAQAGLEVMGRPAMWGVIQTYAASVIGLAIVVRGGGVVPYAFAFAVAPILPLAANARRVWPWLRESRRLQPAVWKALIGGGLPLMVLTGLNLIYGTIDVPILSAVAGDAPVGWYTLAYRFVAIPVFISTATVTAFFPSFSTHGVTKSGSAVSGEFVRLVNRALCLVTAVSVPAAAGIAVIADDLVTLFYDAEYEPSIAIMQILALHVPMAAIGVILGMALIATDRQTRYIVVAAAAAVMTPIVAFFAIHWSIDRYDNGAIGAAITTVATEVFIVSCALRLRSKGVMDRATAWFVVRVALAAGAMAGAVWLAENAHLLLRIALGGAVYGVACLLLRVVAIGDLTGMLGVMGGTVPGVKSEPADDAPWEDTLQPTDGSTAARGELENDHDIEGS